MYHKIIIVGYTGKDPEMRYMPDGRPVANMSVATDKRVPSGDQYVTSTIWFRVSVFGRTAEVVNQYVKKGTLVLVEGELIADPKTGSPRVFTRSDGSAGASFEMSAARVRILSKSKTENGSVGSEDDETPF